MTVHSLTHDAESLFELKLQNKPVKVNTTIHNWTFQPGEYLYSPEKDKNRKLCNWLYRRNLTQKEIGIR